jgi:hypothetical protein
MDTAFIVMEVRMQKFEITLLGMKFMARGTTGIVGAITMIGLVVLGVWLAPEFWI